MEQLRRLLWATTNRNALLLGGAGATLSFAIWCISDYQNHLGQWASTLVKTYLSAGGHDNVASLPLKSLRYIPVPGEWERKSHPQWPDSVFKVPQDSDGEVHYITKGHLIRIGGTALIERLPSGHITKSLLRNTGFQYLDIDEFKYVKVSGICGTFEEGLDYLVEVPNQRIALFLGSTFFNDCEPSVEEAQRLGRFMRPYPEDVIYMSQDCHTDQDTNKVEAAYHTESFERFIWHGVGKLSRAMGLTDDPHHYWEVQCGLKTFPEGNLSHFWQLKANQDIKWENITIKAGHTHEFFESRKSRPEEVRQLLSKVGLIAEVWRASGSQSYLFRIERRKVRFIENLAELAG